MKNLKQKFEENYLLGCMKYKMLSKMYLMPIAWWILNYKKYDPDYDPLKWEFQYRDNVLIVTDNEMDRFFKAVESDKLNLDEFNKEANHIPLEYRHIYFFVDFDKKIFVNSFYDLEVEGYLPDSNWRGEFANAIDYLPENLSMIFRKWVV